MYELSNFSNVNKNSNNTTSDNINRNSSNQRTSNLEENIKLMNRQLSSKHSIEDDDDVDTALSKLEKSLDIVEISTDGSNNENRSKHNESSLSVVVENKSSSHQKEIKENENELCEELYLLKQQKYTFKKLKMYYFILNDTHYLSYYKTKEESKGKPIDKINLRGSELVPDVNISARKFGINIQVPSIDGVNEISLRCPNEESYARWMSACKLASKNKSISDSAFFIESKSILNLLHMQQHKKLNTSNLNLNENKQVISSSNSMIDFNATDNAEVQATNLLPARILKKHKLKQVKFLRLS